MPNWNEVLHEIREVAATQAQNPLDIVRRKYLHKIHEITGRNVIAYYSGWLQKPGSPDSSVNDKDKSGLMLTINKLDKTKGLDLILHTPGGDIAATESLVDYLFSMFKEDIRVFVPQLSMSAGTMIALCSKEIVLGKHSNLGPIDPQVGGLPCQAILNEFEQAKEEIRNNPSSAALWQVIISKYHPTLLGGCKQAIDWSRKMVNGWLLKNMCKEEKDGKSSEQQVRTIIDIFADHTKQKSHGRHISREECKNAGLNITNLEDNQDLQDAVLTTHHAFMHTFSNSTAVKIIENHNGIAYIENSTPQNQQ